MMFGWMKRDVEKVLRNIRLQFSEKIKLFLVRWRKCMLDMQNSAIGLVAATTSCII